MRVIPARERVEQLVRHAQDRMASRRVPAATIPQPAATHRQAHLPCPLFLRGLGELRPLLAAADALSGELLADGLAHDLADLIPAVRQVREVAAEPEQVPLDEPRVRAVLDDLRP